MAEIRATLLLPVWFLMQFFNAFMSLASAKSTQEDAGDAWWAHAGGSYLAVLSPVVQRLTRRTRPAKKTHL
jgi:membrane associated rhomboid family serine protease